MRININTASIQALKELPGIGDKVANLIVQFRQTYGIVKKEALNLALRGNLTEEVQSMIDFSLPSSEDNPFDLPSVPYSKAWQSPIATHGPGTMGNLPGQMPHAMLASQMNTGVSGPRARSPKKSVNILEDEVNMLLTAEKLKTRPLAMQIKTEEKDTVPLKQNTEDILQMTSGSCRPKSKTATSRETEGAIGSCRSRSPKANRSSSGSRSQSTRRHSRKQSSTSTKTHSRHSRRSRGQFPGQGQAQGHQQQSQIQIIQGENTRCHHMSKTKESIESKSQGQIQGQFQGQGHDQI